MVSKHREIIDQYPNERALRPESGGLAPPGIGTIFQPEDEPDIPVTSTPSSPASSVLSGRSNWLIKIAAVELMYHGTSDALAPIIQVK